MTIIEALIKENLRITNGLRWLVAEQNNIVEIHENVWFEVYEKPIGKKKTICLCKTFDESYAVKVLLGESN